MTVEIGVLISLGGLACALLGAVINGSNHRRLARQDAQADGKTNGEILANMGYIKAGIDDIKRKQEQQDRNYVEIVERLVAVEASAKQAHLRIDRSEGRTSSKEERG